MGIENYAVQPGGEPMPLRFAIFLMGAVAISAIAASAATTVTYKYDTLGRLSTVCYSNNLEIVYSYDQAGNRTQVVTQAGGSC
jgi:uncharacterized protein (DUF697 family)